MERKNGLGIIKVASETSPNASSLKKQISQMLPACSTIECYKQHHGVVKISFQYQVTFGRLGLTTSSKDADNVAQFGHHVSTTKKLTKFRATLSGNNVAQFCQGLK